jgi:hypothetical protein
MLPAKTVPARPGKSAGHHLRTKSGNNLTSNSNKKRPRPPNVALASSEMPPPKHPRVEDVEDVEGAADNPLTPADTSALPKKKVCLPLHTDGLILTIA